MTKIQKLDEFEADLDNILGTLQDDAENLPTDGKLLTNCEYPYNEINRNNVTDNNFNEHEYRQVYQQEKEMIEE